jgi:hypothetical protein
MRVTFEEFSPTPDFFDYSGREVFRKQLFLEPTVTLTSPGGWVDSCATERLRDGARGGVCIGLVNCDNWSMVPRLSEIEFAPLAPPDARKRALLGEGREVH